MNPPAQMVRKADAFRELLASEDGCVRVPRLRSLTPLVWLGNLLVWYVLSIGPCFWMWHSARLQAEPTWIEVFYAPLLRACEIPWVRSVVNSYIDLWILS